jgi:hypothetical protein
MCFSVGSVYKVFEIIMAGQHSRTFMASKVLVFLQVQEEFEADVSGPDGSKVLLDAEALAPDSGALIALTLNSSSPAERDSILLLDPDLNPPGQMCVI